MKTNADRFQKVVSMFPNLNATLKEMENAHITYNIGGSVALYVQGNARLPHDVDIMFTDDAHEGANKLFGLKSEIVERPNVSMTKSSPVDDGSIDFLSQYAAIADGRVYCTPPLEKVSVSFESRSINLVPAEKIAVFKLIGRREHHNDLNDFTALFQHSDFDMNLFWKIVDSLDARKVVTDLLMNLELI